MTVDSLFCRQVAWCVLLLVLSAQAFGGEVRVAVASNFTAPMARIVPLFEQATGHTAKISFGSTGKFYAQIRNGAPYDVLLAADESTPKRMVQQGFAVGETRFVYAVGRLVLWSVQPELVDDKGKVLNTAAFVKLAIANPLYSPYGTATKETLAELTMWNAMQRRLDKRDDVTEAYQLAATERAELAFIALSQVMQDGQVSRGSWWLVPETMHNPIRQSAVLLSGAQDVPAAMDFLAFMKRDKVRAVLRGYGYTIP